MSLDGRSHSRVVRKTTLRCEIEASNERSRKRGGLRSEGQNALCSRLAQTKRGGKLDAPGVILDEILTREQTKVQSLTYCNNSLELSRKRAPSMEGSLGILLQMQSRGSGS